MSGSSPKVPYADAVSRLAEANKKRVAKGQTPLTMNKSGDITLSNGAVAAYVMDSKTGKPRFQIYQGAPDTYLVDIQKRRQLNGPIRIDSDGSRHRTRNYPELSAAHADNAWRRAFAHKSYKSESGRKRAMSRNKCSPCPKGSMTTTRFLSNPTKLCYTGLNDGSAPECADRVEKYANPSPKSLAARAVSARKLKEWQQRVFTPETYMGKDKKLHHKLDMAKVAAEAKDPSRTLTNLKDHQSQRVSKPYKTRSKRAQAGGSRHEQEEQEEEEQQGGRAVSLKTAVRLLRQYYNSKYN